LHRDSGPKGAEAKGHKCRLGLAQKVPDFLHLAYTDNLEVLLHLLLGQSPLPIYHLHNPGIQDVLLDIDSKLTG
jgi:hypothetical protein